MDGASKHSIFTGSIYGMSVWASMFACMLSCLLFIQMYKDQSAYMCILKLESQYIRGQDVVGE